MEQRHNREISNSSFYTLKDDRQIKSVKNWMKAYKNHKHLPAENFQINSQKKQTSQSFKLTLVGITGLNHKKSIPSVNLALRIYGNFYSKSVRNFFGRTYESGLIHLQQKEGTTQCSFQTPECLSLFYHTRIDEKADAVVTLEFKLLELQHGSVLVSEKQLGYAEISMLGNKMDKQVELALKRGSPREMISNPSVGQKSVKGEGVVSIYIDECAQFNKVKNLIPDSVLIGSDEHLPGLAGQPPCLPTGINLEKPIQIEYERYDKIIIKPMQFTLDMNLEKKIINMVAQASQGSDKIRPAVEISDRRIRIAFHNTWNCINAQGLNNSLSLMPQVSEEKLILTQTTPLYIETYSLHPHCVLIFQLDYEFYITTERQGKHKQTKALGWLPYPIQPEEFGKEFTISDSFVMGNGRTVEGVRMLDLEIKEGESIKLLIGVDARMPTNAHGKKSSSVEKSKLDFGNDDPIPEKQKEQKEQKPPQAGGNQQVNEQILQQLKQEQEFRKQLESQIKTLQEGVFNQPSQPGGKYQGGSMSKDQYDELSKTLQEFQQRETLLLQQLEMLKAQQINEIKNTQKEMSEIKQLLLEFQDRPKTSNEFYKSSRSGLGGSQFMGQGQQFYQTMGTQQGPLMTKEKDPNTGEIVMRYEGDYERIKFLETLTSVPRIQQEIDDKAFVVGPQFGPQDLSRKDIVYLHNSGIKGILDDTNKGDQSLHILENSDLQVEFEDPLQASKITVQFLALKPQLKTLYTQFSQSDAIIKKDNFFSETFHIPDRIYFSMNFFDFPTFKTDNLTYLTQGQNSTIKQSLFDGNPLILVTEAFLQKISDQKEPRYLFDIDPSKTNFSSAHEEFIKYLFSKSMHIDIWDADSLMLYGSVKFPLKYLLRQGKKEITVQKELEILEPNYNRIKGSLQIQMSHYGFQCQVMQGTTGKHDIRLFNNKETAIKKKIKSQPIDPQKISLKQAKQFDNQDLKIDEDLKKKERIRRYKLQQMTQTQGADVIGKESSLNIEAKKKQIQEITSFKQSKQEEMVKEIISKFLSDEKQIPVSTGKSKIISHQFSNTSNTTQTWTVEINDPDQPFLQKPELILVQNPRQWKYFVDQYGFEKPDNGGQDNYEAICNNRFQVLPQRTLTVLFQFISFREFDPQLQNYDNVQEIIDSKDENYRKEKLYPRTINVFFKEDMQKGINGFKLSIEPHADIVDHLFRYYERENRDIKLELPSLYHYSQPNRENRPRLMATKKAALAEWLSEKVICVKLKVPSSGVKKKFNLLAYSDDYHSDLIGNWQIEINSLSGMDLTVAMGKKVGGNLTIFADIARYTVKLYSSHPLLLWFPPPYDSPFQLTGAKHTPIKMNIKSFSQSTQQVQINCVDITTRELIHSWIIRIDTEEPQITKMYDIDVELHKEKDHKFKFENNFSDFKIFTFESQNPDIISLMKPRVSIDGKGTALIEIKIKASEQMGTAKVFIFANDQEEANVKCFLFKINYKQN